jgi:hypothetical protein
VAECSSPNLEDILPQSYGKLQENSPRLKRIYGTGRDRSYKERPKPKAPPLRRGAGLQNRKRQRKGQRRRRRKGQRPRPYEAGRATGMQNSEKAPRPRRGP